MKYFKSTTPSIPLITAAGRMVRWETSDGRIGYLAADEKVAASLESAMKRKVGGGIAVATQKEYEDFQKKSVNQPVTRQWRQELSPEALKARQPSGAIPGVLAVPGGNAPKAPKEPDRSAVVRRRGGRARVS